MSYNIVDLFTGAGGLTYGFKYRFVNNKIVPREDEFEIVMANELDSDAARTFRTNFPNINMVETSVVNLDYSDYNNIDIIIGGPPCQSFSMVGTRQNDMRSELYLEYNRAVEYLRPQLFIFENVVGILSQKKENGVKYFDDILEKFTNLGYKMYYDVLDSSDYGVPQQRKRVFIVGIRNDINKEWKFPVPCNYECLTLESAISDLPNLANGEGKNRYDKSPQNNYQTMLRNGAIDLDNHVNGLKGERIVKIMNALSEGESKKDINHKVKSGKLPHDLYLTSGYDNTYGKLLWKQPAPTITKNFNSPSTLRCIHPYQNRALTAREAARIQSFPDTFIFKGSKTKVSTQIGNAVPPILAAVLADTILDFLGNK